MNWDAFDYAAAAVLLGGAATAFFLVARAMKSSAARAGLGVAIVTAVLLVWVNGAVGFIGDSGDNANLMFFGVIAIAAGGALIARLRPQGMSAAMLTAAGAQVLVAAVALIAGWGAEGPSYPWDILMGTVFFAALWGASAWLFRRAAQQPSPHSA